MRKNLSFVFIFFFITTQIRAEKTLSTAEIFETPFATQALAWLDRGAEIWIEGESENKSRVKIYAKVWVKRKDMTRSVAKTQAVLHDQKGNPIGGIYKELQTVHDTTSSFSTHVLIFRGYIFKDRVDPKSIPETELPKILDPLKSKADTSHLNEFLKRFDFKLTQDTGSFTLYEMYGKDAPRMGLIFDGPRLVAIIPTKKITLKHFEAELKQASLHIIYLHKLKPEDEQFLTNSFSPR